MGFPRPTYKKQVISPGYMQFTAPLMASGSASSPRTSSMIAGSQKLKYTGTRVFTYKPTHVLTTHMYDTVVPPNSDQRPKQDVDMNTHLNEHIRVLDHTIQQTLPTTQPCGPTPGEYRDILNKIWPVISGETWDQYEEYACLYSATCSTALPIFLATRTQVPSN